MSEAGDILMHSKALPESLRSQVVQAVASTMGGRHYRLLLFGSRTKGRATLRSDYDLALLSEHPIELAILARLREALEQLPILQRIDVVDLSRVSPEFAEQVLREGMLLDER